VSPMIDASARTCCTDECHYAVLGPTLSSSESSCASVPSSSCSSSSNGTLLENLGESIVLVSFVYRSSRYASILPLRFFRNRSQVGASLEAFFLMFVLLLGTYYLPIFLYVLSSN
jgi:hypothetical protein